MYKRRCKITYICHGATIYSEDDRLFDNLNYPPINTSGKYEIEKLSKWLIQRAPKVNIIYSSPSLKAIQSAEIIADKYDTEFETVDDLISKKNGIFNGFNYEQLENLYPDLLEEYHKDKANYIPKGGESLTDFDKKITEIINKIVAANQHKRIIIVTHPDIIQAAIRQALDIPVEKQTCVYIPTGSATQINYYSSWQSLVYSSYLPL